MRDNDVGIINAHPVCTFPRERGLEMALATPPSQLRLASLTACPFSKGPMTIITAKIYRSLTMCLTLF